jgi:hypothetical protein
MGRHSGTRLAAPGRWSSAQSPSPLASRPRAARLKGTLLAVVTTIGVVAVSADPTLGSSGLALRRTSLSTGVTPASSPSATSGARFTPTPRRAASPSPKPAPKATHSPTPALPAGPSTAAPGPAGGPQEAQPSAAEAAAQARAAQLQQAVAQQGQKVQAAQQVLDDAVRTASVALEAYSQAVAAQRAATADSLAAYARLADAQSVLADQRRALGRWARQAYVDGGTLSTNPTLVTLLEGGSTDDIARSVRWLTAVGDSRSRAVTAFASAAADQEAAARRAADAQAAADVAAAAAQQAKATRDAAVEAQRQVVDQLQDQLDVTVDAASAAQRSASLLAQARRYATGGNVLTGPVGPCAGGDVSSYGNGQIPLGVLCPVWGAPGKYLRADAAYAFNRLSSAYAQETGRPLCVTDAYRSYADQVAVHASRPGLSATPGTSNHGWGSAVDLCGGVESFGGAAHVWLQSHAALYGWFHPAWAEPSGSMPEPWHWEFS